MVRVCPETLDKGRRIIARIISFVFIA